MKKILFFALLPLVAVASYDLSPIEDCERLKENMMQDLNYQESNILEGINPALLTFTNRIDSLIGQVDAIRRLDTDDDYEMDLLSLRGNIASLNANVYYTLDYSNNAYEYTQYLKATVNAINCTTCDGSSSSNCCDFTEILQAIGNVSNGVNIVIHELSVISNQLNSLEYTNFLLDHGFGDITNMLNFANWEALPYSPFNPASGLNSLYGLRTLSQGTRFSVGQLSLNTISANARDNGWLPSIWWQNFDQLKIMGSLNSFELNKYLNFYGPVTNALSSITNNFSLLRSDINPQHSLAHWSGGSIYDYLTNQYLDAINVSPSNWHSRVESLLAALVFQDSAQSSSDKEQDIEDEVQDGLDDALDKRTELESAFDSEENITFLDLENFDTFEMPDIEVSDDKLPDELYITFGALTWFDDTYSDQIVTIDLTNKDVVDFLTLVRSFFTVLWWGAVLLFVWWLFKWFLRFLKWVWSAIKGIDFGA